MPTDGRRIKADDRGAVRRLFWIFFKAEGTRPYLVLLCLLLAGAFEAISLSAMLPTVTKIGGGPSEHSSGLNETVVSAVSAIGLEPTLPVLICVGGRRDGGKEYPFVSRHGLCGLFGRRC